MKDIWKTLLLGGALYYGVAPNAAVDVETGQVAPVIEAGPGAAYVLPPPDMTPQYVVPAPVGGGASLYIQPGESE